MINEGAFHLTVLHCDHLEVVCFGCVTTGLLLLMREDCHRGQDSILDKFRSKENVPPYLLFVWNNKTQSFRSVLILLHCIEWNGSKITKIEPNFVFCWPYLNLTACSQPQGAKVTTLRPGFCNSMHEKTNSEWEDIVLPVFLIIFESHWTVDFNMPVMIGFLGYTKM